MWFNHDDVQFHSTSQLPTRSGEHGPLTSGHGLLHPANRSLWPSIAGLLMAPRQLRLPDAACWFGEDQSNPILYRRFVQRGARGAKEVIDYIRRDMPPRDTKRPAPRLDAEPGISRSHGSGCTTVRTMLERYREEQLDCLATTTKSRFQERPRVPVSKQARLARLSKTLSTVRFQETLRKADTRIRGSLGRGYSSASVAKTRHRPLLRHDEAPED